MVISKAMMKVIMSVEKGRNRVQVSLKRKSESSVLNWFGMLMNIMILAYAMTLRVNSTQRHLAKVLVLQAKRQPMKMKKIFIP